MPRQPKVLTTKTMAHRVEEDGIYLEIFFVPKLIPYHEIVSLNKVTLPQRVLKCLNIFRPPLISISIDPGWYSLLLETRNRQYIAFTPDDLDRFLRIATAKWEAAKVRTKKEPA
jgi:hypothetical protein